MRFEVNGMTELRRSDCVDMRDFIVFKKNNNYLHCEDTWFGEKMKRCPSIDMVFKSFDWDPIEDKENAKLLIMRADEIHKGDYAVFVQDNLDIWCYIDISRLDMPPHFGDKYYVTVRFNDEV